MVSTKDCIHDFIEAWKQWDSIEASTRVNGTFRPVWNDRFQNAGYYSVVPSSANIVNSWQEIHRWCKEHVGSRHYVWAGSIFWFDSDRAAMWFKLRWA
jgi:hypothetical protein